MLAPHEPTWLDWLIGTVAVVLWDFGPALARDALDTLLRPAPTPAPPEEGPGGTMTRSEAARLRATPMNSRSHHPQEKSPMSKPTSQPTPETQTPTEELLTRWFDAHRAEQTAHAACERARAALDEAMADRCAAERELYQRLAAGTGEPPRAWPYRSLVVWAEAGVVRFLRLAPKE